MDFIKSRRSIRRFTDKKISEEDLMDILAAAMAAPSAGNEQPWEFVVINDKQIMESIMAVHPYAKALRTANLAVTVCGNTDLQLYEGFWVQDCSAATQNILLEATEKGIGSLWIGVYPNEERIGPIREILGLPENVIPLSIVALGYPDEEKEPSKRFNSARIHVNKW